LLHLADTTPQELDQAKHTIADLEDDLKAERARLRDLTVEQGRAEREKENVLLELRRTESDMEDVKHQLQRVKRDKDDLEGELRGMCCHVSHQSLIDRSSYCQSPPLRSRKRAYSN
jgi:septal ring factor EnvC (AmiA/AmiB activator)